MKSDREVLVVDSSVAAKWFLPTVESVIASGLRFMEPSAERLRSAIQTAYRYDIFVYDAAFVALAEELNCRLVTADRRLVDRVGTGSAVLLSSI